MGFHLSASIFMYMYIYINVHILCFVWKIVFNSAAPRLNTTSIETTVALQFDSTPLLLLSIQVNIDHVVAVALGLSLYVL